MKLARLAAAAASIFGAWLVACASDEDASPEESTTESRVPVLDGGADADASETDASDSGLPCTPERICPSGAPFDPSTPGGAVDLRVRIMTIRGRSATDVWAVGAHGTAAHFDGTSWSRSDTGATESFRTIWLRESSELALASFSVIYSRNVELDGPDGGAPSAGNWLHVKAPVLPPELWENTGTSGVVTSAWTTPDAEWLWGTTLVSSSTLLDAPANGMWRARIAPGTRTIEIASVFPAGTCQLIGCLKMLGLHGSSPDDLWAVGAMGATFHITGAQGDAPTVTAFNSQTLAGLEGVWARSPTDVWAVGGAGTIRHYTGGAASWDVVDGVPAIENLHAVWGTSSSDIWAVGDAATVLHYDGAAWSRVEVAGLGLRRPDLYTVWSPAPGHVWIGGDGVILSLGGKP